MTVAGMNLADEVGSGDEVILHSGSLYQGTSLKSYTIERQFSDLTNTFIACKGMRPSSMSLSAQTGQILTGQLAFSGKSPLAVATATAARARTRRRRGGRTRS